MAGGLEAKTNPHVEAWGYSREVVEKTFRFTPRSLALIGLFGIGVPVFIYRSTVKDFNTWADKNGKPRKTFM